MSASERRDAERRLATALLAVLAVLLVAGTGAWLLGGHGRGREIQQVNAGETALQSARVQIDQVFGGGADLVQASPQKALGLLRGAWVQLDAAEQAGVPAGRLQPLRDEVAGGLDRLYGAVTTSATTVVTMKKLDPAADLSGLVLGPDGAAYSIDRAAHAVVRFDLSKRTASVVVRAGDGPGTGVGDPWMLTTGGPDLVIVDRNGGVWRWRPADRNGHGTLGVVRIGGSVTWGTDIRDVETYLHSADAGLYNLYVVDPSSRQILRYSPAADGSGFPADPTGYLATAADVSAIEQILVDGDVYALTPDTVTRFVNGRPDSFAPQTPLDDQDLRPGHHYQLMAASVTRQQGTLYLYDAAHQRIVAFDKAYGDYKAEYIASPGTPAFADVRGMFLVEAGGGKVSSIVWVTQDRILVTVLQPASPAGSPSGSPAPPPTAPRATPKASAYPRRTVAPTATP